MAVRYARLTALLVTTAAIGIGAVEVAADLEAKSELRRISAAHPELSVKAIRAEPFGGRVVLEGVNAGRGPGAHVSIGRLTLAKPYMGFGFISTAHAESALDRAVRALDAQPKAEPPAFPGATPGAGDVKSSADIKPSAAPPGAPGTATAENVVITKGAKVVRIKRIDLTGTSLSNADLAALLDANSGESAETRLRKLNATSIDVPEIVADDPTPGSESHIVVSQVKLSGVVAGKATAASVGSTTLQAKTGQKTTDGSVGAFQAFGVDFAQAAHVVGTVRKDDNEPILPIFDSATINAIKLSNGGDGVFTIATMKEAGVKARALQSDALASPNKDPSKMSKAEQAALFKDMTQSFEIGSLDMSDIALNSTEAAKPFKFTLSSLGMRGFGKRKFGGLGVRGIRFDSPDVKMGLGSIEVGPLSLPQDVSGSANTMMAASGKVDFDQIDMDVPNTVGGASEPRVKFKIGHSSFMSEGEAGEIPVTVKLAVDNFVFDMPADTGQAKPLVEMGYRHLDVSAGFASTYDGGKQQLAIRDITLKGVDMGSVGIGLQLLNVTKGIISPDKNVQKASALAMLVKGLTLDVVNEGLVDRIIEWKAKQDRMSVDTERATIIEFFDKTLPAQFTSANVKVVGSAIAKFIAAPKKLHIDVVSKSGLGAGSMALLNDPNLLLDTLEVTASAN